MSEQEIKNRICEGLKISYEKMLRRKAVLGKFKVLLSLVAVTFIVTSCNSDSEDFVLNNKSNSRSIEVEPLYISYVYPSVSEIINDPTVYNAMFIAWYETLSFATEEGRREVGFYIYCNLVTKKLSVGETVYGPFVKYDAGTPASVRLGDPTDKETVCAFFHTHTPLTFCPFEAYRNTGPSEDDIAFAQSSGLPGIVYDYLRIKIWSGHSPTDDAKLYTFGVTRRKNP